MYLCSWSVCVINALNLVMYVGTYVDIYVHVLCSCRTVNVKSACTYVHTSNIAHVYARTYATHRPIPINTFVCMYVYVCVHEANIHSLLNWNKIPLHILNT